jgi:hypothetical protein
LFLNDLPLHAMAIGSIPGGSAPRPSMIEVDDQGNSATWGAHVTDEEYGAPASSPTHEG